MFGPNYRRTWLWRSVAIGVIGQAGMWNGLLDAQPAPMLTPVLQGGVQPQLKPVPTGGSVSQVQGTAPANSDISRQLEMLYRQDGREVPEYLQSPGGQAPANQPVYQAPQAGGRPMTPNYQPMQQQRPGYAPQPGQVPSGPRPPQQYARPGATPAGMPRPSAQYGNAVAPGMRVPPGSNGYYQPQGQPAQAPAYQTYPASMAQPSYQQPQYNQQPQYTGMPQPAPKGNPVTGFFKKLVGGKSAQPAQPYAPTNVAPTPPDYARTQGMVPPAPGEDEAPARMMPAAPQSAPPAMISAVPSATPIVTNVLDAYGVPPSPTGGAPQFAATTTPRVEAAPVQQPVISPAPQQPVTQQPVATATQAPANGPSLALPPAPQPAAAPATPQAAPGIATARSAPGLPMLPPVADDAPAFVPEPAAPATNGLDVAGTAETKSPEADPFDLANAFPEMSEAAADGVQKETPFTGLALDEADDVDMTMEEAAAPAETAQAKAPATTEQPILEAPGAPRLELPPLEAEAAATAKTEPAADPFAEDPFASQPIEPEPKKEPAAAAPALAAPTLDDPFAPSPAKAAVAEKPARTTNGAPALLPQTPAANAAPVAKAAPSEADEKMRRIRERDGMTGLKGFCPVTLRDQRELRDAQTQFESAYRGQKYHFASADAKLRFEANPARYAPAAYGADVVSLARDKDVVEGTLDHAAWFRGRLYLFGSQASHDEFVSNPVEFAVGIDED
ncbi:MAG: YHS domain-containing protein [Planctomycetaceae bacterium]|nr:YHS domain-containing protein [Planctomycetaceae bacterium]